VCGGKDEDYYTIVDELRDMEVDELIEIILAQRELDAMNDAKKQQQQKKEVKNIEETPTEKKVESIKKPQEKKLKKQYSSIITTKAQLVTEVLGGKEEDYYELVSVYSLSNINDLVEMLINDPTVLEKHNSYI